MPQFRISTFLLVSVCLLNQTGTQAAGSYRPHIDSVARAARDQNTTSRLIVRYRAGAGPRRQELVASGQRLRDLASDPGVLGISTDAVIRPHGASFGWGNVLPAQDAQQLRRTLGLHAFPSGGLGVGIAVIDSGIAPMPDFAGRISAFYDFTAGGIATWPSDEYGHGTHVAGLIAGSGAQSLGASAGIAPEARLIGLKVLDAQGAGYTSDVIDAIEFAVANRKLLGIDIINLSLGHPILEPAATDPLVQAVEQAAAAGIVVVTSAGNFGETGDTKRTGFAGFSSRGPTWFDGTIKPDVLAPGVSLAATNNPTSTLAKSIKVISGHITLSGTSMASAVAAGVVALMLEANRNDNPYTQLSPNTVKLLLQYSALQVSHDASAVELIEGSGGINAAGAVELARAINPSAMIGDRWLEYGVTTATPLRSWTRCVTWGDRLVEGEMLNRKELAWSSKPVWGTTLTWSPDSWLTASTVLDTFDFWSSQVVKGDKPVKAQDDDHIVWGNADQGDGVSGNCSSAEDDHIVWGSATDDHIVWGNTTIKKAGRR